MNIDRNMDQNILVLTPKLQAIDHKVSKDFKNASHRIVEESGYPYTILNLQEVQFIDSSGFGCVLSILKLLSAHDKDLVLVGLTPPIKEIFHLMSMQKIFEIYPTVTEAQHALASSSAS